VSVSREVADALAVSGLPREAQACLGALAEGEGGVSFLTLYGGALWTGPLDHFPTAAEWNGATGPTGDPTSALGFLQFERGTYAECAAKTGLHWINPQSQIANGWWLAQHDYAKRSGGGDLLAALLGDRTTEVSAALLSTWPGGADPNPNHNSGFVGFPAAYARFLATLPEANPAPYPEPSPTAFTPFTVPITGGHLSTDPTIATATLSPDGQTIIIEPVAVGATTVSYSLTVPVVVKAILVAGPD
jgi:hypothetical protein